MQTTCMFRLSFGQPPDSSRSVASERSLLRILRRSRPKRFQTNASWEGRCVTGILLFVDLGLRVLDGAEVDTATYVLQATLGANPEGCCYWDFRKEDRKILQNLSGLLSGRESVFRRHIDFANTPANLIAYLASGSDLEAFSSGNHLDPDYGRVTKGLSSSDDFRFLLLMWEPPAIDVSKRWIFCAKGADYYMDCSKYQYSHRLV